MIVKHGGYGLDCERKTAECYEVDEIKPIHSYFYIANSLVLYIEYLLVINVRNLHNLFFDSNKLVK